MSHDFSIERSGMNKFSLSLVFIGALLGLSFIMVSISYGQGEDAPEIARQAEVTVVQESAPGEAAFYGPKLDFMAEDAHGRFWQVATIQLDMNMPERFDLTCVNEKGEAERIITVKAAEAAAQSNALHGKGIAAQREAIIEGLSKSVNEFREHIPGTSAHDVMFLVLMTQYFDTLKDISANAQTNTILLPHSPSTLTDLSEQMRNAMLIAGQVQNTTKK